MMKNQLSFLFCLVCVLSLTGCDIAKDSLVDALSQQDKNVVSETQEAPAPLNEVPPSRPYVAFVSDGRSDNYWQAIVDGATESAAVLDVITSFDVPAPDAAAQTELLEEILAKNPSAICISAIDSAALEPLLQRSAEENIPILGIRNGVSAAEGGIVDTNIGSNPTYAGALAADSLWQNALFSEKIKGATLQSPVVIAVQISDPGSYRLDARARGFLERMKTLLGAVHPGHVSVTGHPSYASYGPAGTIINLMVVSPGAPTEEAGAALAENTLQGTQNLIAYFCTDELSANALLAATDEGSALNRANGAYGSVAVIGFDSGIRQKFAVSDQLFIGAVTDDPYQTGYLAIDFAYQRLQGDPIPANINTGSKLYTKDNITDPAILRLLND